MESMTLFSWGYWGWGNATPQLVEAVDAVEAARGFAPPLFVDVRFSRSVRANGFRDRAFEQLVGPKRYTWMRSLGNKRIETRTGPAIQIAEPAAANELLDLVLRAAAEKRRVLFFCSCERPIGATGEKCHRVTVADLTRSAASNRGIALETVEWPGGTLDAIELQVPRPMIRSVRNGRASLPLGKVIELGRLAGLAWGTRVTLRDADEKLVIASGPAMFQAGGWCLPVLKRFTEPAETDETQARWASRFRKAHGYLPDRSNTGSPELSPSCIYTIAHLDKLRSIETSGGVGELSESKRWVTGRGLFDSARESGLDMPILFADAADCSKLLYWAILTGIRLAADGTHFAFERLRRISKGRTPQDLNLLSSGRKIAPGFIRPYALCRTPAFISDDARAPGRQ